MDLILNTYGTDLMVKDGIFYLINDQVNQSIAPLKVDSILVATGITLTSNAIKLALEHGIEIQFIDSIGNSYGKIWHVNFGSIATIRKKQLALANSKKCIVFVKEIICDKIESQTNFLSSLKRYRSNSKQGRIDEAIAKITEISQSMKSVEGPINKVRNRLMGYEGSVSKLYFQTLSYLLPSKYKFSKRSRQPAKDVFNAFLNYGYGILYSKVESSLIRAGLDPYIGIFHVDGYNRKAFLFDFIEKYRVIIDSVVLSLFTGKKIGKKHYKKLKESVSISSEGRKLIILNINQKFNSKKEFNGRMEKIETIIQLEAHAFAKDLLEDSIC